MGFEPATFCLGSSGQRALWHSWTTLIYGFAQPNGLSLLNIIFLVPVLLIDLGTWGIGFFASRQHVFSYRGT